MSLLPLLLNDNWSNIRPFSPSRMHNQQFGQGLDLDDVFSLLTHPVQLGAIMRCPGGYYRPWQCTATKNDQGSTMTAARNKFQVDLDVQQFAPEEITVKVTGNNVVTVEGKHEEKQDEHGYVSRHFVRKYVLPDGHDINNLVASLSSDGILSITAPRIESTKEEKEHTIPIQQTGVPLNAVKVEKDKPKEAAKEG